MSVCQLGDLGGNPWHFCFGRRVSAASFESSGHHRYTSASYKGGRMARENLDALINEIKARMKTIRDSL